MNSGKLILVIGCMFAGKSSYLINEAKQLLDQQKNVKIYHPEIDTRYTKNAIASHNNHSIESISLSISDPIIDISVPHIIIDEVQFFDEIIVDQIRKARENGSQIFVGGLSSDFRGQEFPVVHSLKQFADEMIEVFAKCEVCGKDAIYSYRKYASVDDKTIVVGGSDLYEARCKLHFETPKE